MGKKSDTKTVVWSKRKRLMFNHAGAMAKQRLKWIERNKGYHESDAAHLNFVTSINARVLDLGCGNGWLLSKISASKKVGVDLSPQMLVEATKNCPDAIFIEADVEDKMSMPAILKEGPYDYILLSDTLAYLDDIEIALSNIASLCTAETRIVISTYNHLWEPFLKAGEVLGRKQKQDFDLNWLSDDDLQSFCNLSGLEILTTEKRQLIPFHLFGLGQLVNKWIAPLPIIRAFNIRQYNVLRHLPQAKTTCPSVSVVVPVRNEAGNIESAVTRLSSFPGELEIIFVEGNSNDQSWKEIQRVKEKYLHLNIVATKQTGKGKGDAVNHAFQMARGDILMILDGDLTVPPEDMIKFYNVLVSGKGEFVNGTRLIYKMEPEAMRFLNYYANRVFAHIFSYLLNQRFTDTLCGTKVMFQRDYKKILANKSFFGDFDPFGDFDFIFGAAKLNMKIVEVPVRYRARSYGSTQISRFKHGFMLLKMVIFAFRKLKAQ